MFKKPLPNEAPVLGKAMTRGVNKCVIDQIPDGEYYTLACAIKRSVNPLNYFFLNNALRDLQRTSVRFPLEEDTEVFLTLRDRIPTDPAITINPVKLLVAAIRRGD
ncbi:MAG: hypothetical protein LBS99_05825 [Clostridiales bacterium]|jgi:hypothetical protein|nr:hypothetical protein [Clostridiales bacterium]